MTTKKKTANARLAHEAFASVFAGSREEGRVPRILTEPLPLPHTAAVPPPTRSRRAVRPTLELPLEGFTHPRDGQASKIAQEFKAVLARESKAVAQVVYEVIDQTVGWNAVSGYEGQQEWVPLSLQHFVHACEMSISQVQKGVKTALSHGYIIRRPLRSPSEGYEYAIRWRTEAPANPA
jgi:hypothetical protein